MNLALFDLDHTLIAFDSGMAWTDYLVRVGALAEDANSRYLDFCHQYVAGSLDIHAMHRASVAPLRAFGAAQLLAWRKGFELEISARLSDSARALVDSHHQAGDLCAIVTATTRFVAEPFARLFGVEHLVATEWQTVDGVPSGEIDGLPCYRENKTIRVCDWLAGRGGGRREFTDFERSWFYSDSISDLPLLNAVTDPVAVCPDARLRDHALARNWPIVDWA
jgi:HAD superfamily hydrolase (TIGR01490 family)